MHVNSNEDDHVSPKYTSIKMAIKVKRQVREIAGSFYLCLPKYWADDAGIVKNQSVTIELTDEHSIRVIAPGGRP